MPFPTVSRVLGTFVIVQWLSHVRLFATPWTAAPQASLSITNSYSLLKLCPPGLWCHPITSSSVDPFSSCPQSLPASESFPVCLLFTAGGQSIEASASASVLPMNIQDWFPLGLTGWISLCPIGSRGSSSALQFESISFSVLSLLSGPTLTSMHDYWKDHSFDYTDLCLTAGRNKKEGEYSWCPHIHSYVVVTRTGTDWIFSDLWWFY